MTLLPTIAAGTTARATFGTILLHFSMKSATTQRGTTYLCEVSGLIALPTFHVVGRARLRTIRCFVTWLATVSTSATNLAGLWTIALTMTCLVAIEALDLDANPLGLILSASFGDVSELWRGRSIRRCPRKCVIDGGSEDKSRRLTVAVVAERQDVLHRRASILQALHVLLRAAWEAFGELGPLRLGAVVVPDDELAVGFALQIDAC